jgi:hypothetical protein
LTQLYLDIDIFRHILLKDTSVYLEKKKPSHLFLNGRNILNYIMMHVCCTNAIQLTFDLLSFVKHYGKNGHCREALHGKASLPCAARGMQGKDEEHGKVSR